MFKSDGGVFSNETTKLTAGEISHNSLNGGGVPQWISNTQIKISERNAGIIDEKLPDIIFDVENETTKTI